MNSNDTLEERHDKVCGTSHVSTGIESNHGSAPSSTLSSSNDSAKRVPPILVLSLACTIMFGLYYL
jgi:hypothetical protein